jgi:hypothetical protein
MLNRYKKKSVRKSVEAWRWRFAKSNSLQILIVLLFHPAAAQNWADPALFISNLLFEIAMLPASFAAHGLCQGSALRCPHAMTSPIQSRLKLSSSLVHRRFTVLSRAYSAITRQQQSLRYGTFI